MNSRYSDNEANSLITKNTPRIVEFFSSIDHMLDNLEKMRINSKPILNGERYITDKELSERLKISRRALQEYCNEGRIPYYQIGAKILYRESDVEKILEANYRKSYR
ncbi:helix-turn-helix domain-containing protein [Dysgonomonas sp. Marseille-P4677]|uniref:helix-turn-helix domain-containing protein n=1 Tax=Dysgonomonas sp. Marseille-P4677 TaxID=2364790 RepID=UPI001914408D|nr:helix-turn-helix domain-containing protein [Dysgonomonas sp. Marseille-P4677]MBK5722174.1 helix-turn-helix domain-containing protein [Dysgonomonas sp. Marseille-P4677]